MENAPQYSLVVGIRIIRVYLDGTVEAFDRLLLLEIVLQDTPLGHHQRIQPNKTAVQHGQ